MKKLKNLMLITLIGMSVLSTWSCNNEELYEEPVAVVEDGSNEDADVAVTDVNSPCDFSLENLDPNSTVVINCILDLQGEALDLPENVTLLDEGGDIINGTLNFSEGSSIDGDLLGSTLTVGGTKPALRDVSFTFDPSRWGIVEGVVSDEVALKNKEIINNVIELCDSYGINSMNIGSLDCYVAVGCNYSLGTDVLKYGIQLPSNFSLSMSSDTFLRVQPNKWPRGSLLNLYASENVVISGGNLIGDRYEHDYSPIDDEFGISRDSHEWPMLLTIAGGNNVLIENVNMQNSTGDGIVFASGTNRLYNPAIYCENIIMRNCVVNNARRNNVTLGDAEYVTIENCDITNAGGGDNILDSSGKISKYTSAGVAPQFGMDLEAHRELENGVYVDYQKIQHITIKGNTFTGNYAGDLVVYTANDVLIEDNFFDNTVGGTLFWNTTIRNNTFKQNEGGVKTSVAIGFNAIIRNNEHQVRNINISGNSISGYDTGISPGGENIEVYKNTVKDFDQGVYLRNLVNSKLSFNDFQTDRKISYGYQSFGGIADNVIVSNEYIKVNHRPVNFFTFNKNGEGSIVFEGCKFDSSKELYFYNAQNITIKNNFLRYNKITTSGSLNIVLDNNLNLL
ncbi:NosD domain-containing protein [Algibacter sp. Ld11]|uniref:NosD domain-containing protein n=1 Tax=Algibacter sp. Ld11 TaxID=649150 RepID=UPI003866FAF7